MSWSQIQVRTHQLNECLLCDDTAYANTTIKTYVEIILIL